MEHAAGRHPSSKHALTPATTQSALVHYPHNHPALIPCIVTAKMKDLCSGPFLTMHSRAATPAQSSASPPPGSPPQCATSSLCEAWARCLQTSLGEPPGHLKQVPSLEVPEHSISQQGPRSLQGLDDQAPPALSSFQSSSGLSGQDAQPQVPHRTASPSPEVPKADRRAAHAGCPCPAKIKCASLLEVPSVILFKRDARHDMNRW